MIFLFAPILSKAQSGEKNTNDDFKETYFSFAPLAVLEPHLTLGASFGQRLTNRSEYFAELSYVAKTFIYNQRGRQSNAYSYKLNGARMIVQYRYHFLQRWRPIINLGQGGRKKAIGKKIQPFMGVEFRYKPYNFSSTGDFINQSIADTLLGIAFIAHDDVLGGALIFGNTFNLTKDKRWKLELTFGIGAKQRFVKFISLPKGYIIYRSFIPKDGPIIPPPQEETGAPYFPISIRLRYCIK